MTRNFWLTLAQASDQKISTPHRTCWRSLLVMFYFHGSNTTHPRFITTFFLSFGHTMYPFTI
ncbi:hypothetical protein PISMIDRAFT_685898 [Pisolithus microcarpus 441]|uniref:Uncharacterized protein n=1 Tax=Pisolithus microcarpus 441 TaxID=765257 RepID=A0A0C9ZAD7_9AGAM|nr:hypothetical protein PISMIDRAFT_685898 [Pisolithus microcarpus 441]